MFPLNEARGGKASKAMRGRDNWSVSVRALPLALLLTKEVTYSSQVTSRYVWLRGSAL